jgi:vitamin B12 transporter
VTENVNAYVRLENLTNAYYEEVRDYGTTGRAIYAGVKVTW